MTVESRGPVISPFKLIDHNNQAIDDKTFLGKHLLVFFGFTHCQKVCPRALQRITDALNQLGSAENNINVIYVTVDPERDTADVMRQYLEVKHPGILGVTGDELELKDVKKGFRVFAQRIEDRDAPDGYTMPHSALTYLMSPESKYLGHFPDTIDSSQLASRLKEVLLKEN